MGYRIAWIAFFVSVLSVGCVKYPHEGGTAESDDGLQVLGGVPFSSQPVFVYCEYVVHPGTGDGYELLGYSNAESEVRPEFEEYGGFYFWHNYVYIPETCWHSDGHANLRFRAAHDSKWYSMYTYDDTIETCMPEDPPYTGNDWASCAQNSSGLLTVCRHGTAWNGSSCI